MILWGRCCCRRTRQLTDAARTSPSVPGATASQWVLPAPADGALNGTYPQTDGGDGLRVLVTPRDPLALAEAIGPLLESPSRRAEFARVGLERVRSRYSWDRVAADTAAVYEQTVRRQDVGQALSAPIS